MSLAIFIMEQATVFTDAVTFGAPELVYRKIVEKSDALVANKADPFRMIATHDGAAIEASRRDDVRVRVLQLEASLALTESMNAYAKGDASGARANLAKKKAELSDFATRTKSDSLAAEAANFDNVMRSVAAAPAASGEAAQDMIKSQKARAFELRR